MSEWARAWLYDWFGSVLIDRLIEIGRHPLWSMPKRCWKKGEWRKWIIIASCGNISKPTRQPVVTIWELVHLNNSRHENRPDGRHQLWSVEDKTRKQTWWPAPALVSRRQDKKTDLMAGTSSGQSETGLRSSPSCLSSSKFRSWMQTPSLYFFSLVLYLFRYLDLGLSAKASKFFNALKDWLTIFYK